MIRGLIFFISFFIIMACQMPAKYPERGPQSFKIEYRYEDNPEQRRVLLYFRNTSRRPVCFGPENWPQKGILLNPGNEVSLEVEAQSYYLGAENDYCPRCSIKVSPGEEIQGFFDYKSFGLPGQIERAEKKLLFSPDGFSCL